MRFLKSYCGLTLCKYNNLYMCISRYSKPSEMVRCSGSYEECNSFFNDYVEKVDSLR